MAERSPSHGEFRYEPHELGLNMSLADDADLYNNSEGIRSLGHLMLSFRQIEALRATGTISDTQFDQLQTVYHGLMDQLRDIFNQGEL